MSLSIQHEAPLEVCDRHPRVVASLLTLLLSEELPRYDELRMEPADFTQTVAKEYRADRALVFLRSKRPVLAVIIEVQRRRDERKRRAWPVYTAALYSRLGCPTYLLVVTLDEATARWAREPIAGFQPGSRFAPLVVARADVPAVRSLEEARANMPLALFSALLHVGTEGGEHVAYYAVRALYESSPESERLDRTIWMLGLVGGIVGRAKFKQIERLVMIEPSTKIIPRLQIIRDRAIAKGLAKGLAKGILEGEARALLKLLAVRGLSVTEAQRRQVMACRDPEQLEAWIERAATAGSAAAVLGSAPRRAAGGSPRA
jgi:hypothetical protein